MLDRELGFRVEIVHGLTEKEAQGVAIYAPSVRVSHSKEVDAAVNCYGIGERDEIIINERGYRGAILSIDVLQEGRDGCAGLDLPDASVC